MFFGNNWHSAYLVYDAALLAAMLITSALAAMKMARLFREAGRERLLYLAGIVFVFLLVELLLVQPTQQLYNDEFIHMSIAKGILYDNSIGICSFSSPLHCVTGTSGLFQQPTGWAMMLSVVFALAGVSFGSAYALVLALSALSIILVFYIARMLLDDWNVALVSSLLFAATPIFLTYSRSLVLDTPELTMMLLGVALLLTYLRRRDSIVGVAAAAALAYTTIMKVDAIVVVPIVATVVLLGLYSSSLKRKGWKRRMVLTAGVAVLFGALVVPQLAFLYNSWNANSFGAASMQSRFSVSNFISNLPQNVEFWYGGFGSIVFGRGYYTYNIEYPTTYAALAVIGFAFLAYARRWRVAALLVVWFGVVFAFYTAYYAGGALYSAGDDIRYFMSAFPAVAMLAAFGTVESAKAIANRLPARGKPRRKYDWSALALGALLVVVMLDPVYDFAVFVHKPPQDIYPFAAERFDQQFIMANYQKIPNGCFVLTYKPPLWYVLNKSNIYADWIFLDSYKGTLLNMSRGCLYFDYSVSCTLNESAGGYDNSQLGCSHIMSNFTMEPVAQAPYDRFGWNITFGIYRIVSYKNGTSLYNP